MERESNHIPPRRKALKSVFFMEMALSPVVAGLALLVPEVKHWGAYGYIPAIVWVAFFIQCLFTFRWRGLWFLLGPPLAFVAIEAVLVAAPPAAQRTAPALSPVQQ
jgi:ABC-type molybdate transport system permease subunit